MNNKAFALRLNKELDEIGMPARTDERVDAFATLIHVPHFKAEAILNGNMNPEPPLLELLSEELEVNPEWLLGKSERRQN